jgi:hypothetical protein
VRTKTPGTQQVTLPGRQSLFELKTYARLQHKGDEHALQPGARVKETRNSNRRDGVVILSYGGAKKFFNGNYYVAVVYGTEQLQLDLVSFPNKQKDLCSPAICVLDPPQMASARHFQRCLKLCSEQLPTALETRHGDRCDSDGASGFGHDVKVSRP